MAVRRRAADRSDWAIGILRQLIVVVLPNGIEHDTWAFGLANVIACRTVVK
jgi:hypothetical protein